MSKLLVLAIRAGRPSRKGVVTVAKRLCWFDKYGNLINIGDWDYQIRTVLVGEREVEAEVPDDYELQPGETWVDESPGVKKVKRIEPVYEDQITNPLPEGAYTQEIEIVEGPDGGLYPADYVPPKTPEQIALEQQQQALDDLTLAFADLLAKQSGS